MALQALSLRLQMTAIGPRIRKTAVGCTSQVAQATLAEASIQAEYEAEIRSWDGFVLRVGKVNTVRTMETT